MTGTSQLFPAWEQFPVKSLPINGDTPLLTRAKIMLTKREGEAQTESPIRNPALDLPYRTIRVGVSLCPLKSPEYWVTHRITPMTA